MPAIPVTPIDPKEFGPATPLWLPTYLSPLIAEPLADGIHWINHERFFFESAELDRILCIPPGFITDFASTPRILWTLVGAPTGWYSKAAMTHDYCFDTPGVATFHQSNRVFREAMQISAKHNALQQWALYEGVQVFGRSSYRGGL